MDNIIEELKEYENKVEERIRNKYSVGYIEGFSTGFEKAFNLANIEVDISNIDWYSIQIFSKWCYINGIDFSYMGKAEDTVPFTDRVISKFKSYMEESDNVN